MPELSIRDQIKKMIDLQKLDVEIYNFRKELKERPLFIEQLKEDFDKKKVNLKDLEEKLKKIQVDRKGKELDLQQKETDLAKANAQLAQMKTNKEYQAKMTEIENIKADKSIIEENILLSFEESDALAVQFNKEKVRLSQEETEYLVKKKEVEDFLKEIQEKLAVLEGHRSHIIPEVGRSYLQRYERILENKEGLAMVPVLGNSCGGCFMNVPQQVINEMKMHDKLIFCEMCARILYLEDDF